PFYIAGQNLSFKLKQLKYDNVKTAYIDKENSLKKLVIKKGFRSFSNHALLRYFKYEQVLELWIKPPTATNYSLLKRYKACGETGNFGPKKLLGDRQIPEGIYELDKFLPTSDNFLAVTINYPNNADANRNSQQDEVSIGGNCANKGNINFDVESMKELYVILVEAKGAGQKSIPIHIFPATMVEKNITKLQSLHPSNEYYKDFWASLKVAFNYFNKTRKEPTIGATDNGMYVVQSATGDILWTPESKKNPQILTASYKRKPSAITTRGVLPTSKVGIKQVSTNDKSVADGSKIHFVGEGETLYAISRKYQVSLDNIRQWNSLFTNNLTIGQAIKVSAPPFYIVKQGDTMYSIAKKHGLTLTELQSLNNMNDFSIKPGDRLRVKKG
ncbi:MAG: LysM peptidoglycan-binding domain-containing protein, partial [Bacteroidota bacterium]